MNVTMNSPFRYAGGKFYARKIILEHIQSHDTYVELFAGGASIFFAKPKSKNNWLNDIDKELINCLTVIRDTPKELIYVLRNEEATKERHKYYKLEFKPTNNLESALRWYYLNRTSYSGIMNMKNCYWGYGDKFSMRPENWGANILRTSRKLEDVKLTNLDFEEVMQEVENLDNVFIFIDPPYFNADQDKFYQHSFSKEDHFRLAKILESYQNKCKFLITYDNCKEVKTLYSWAKEILEKEWNYTINRTDDQKTKSSQKGSRYKGQEIFIMNYQVSVKQLLAF